MLNLIIDVVITFIILLSFILAVSNKTNKKINNKDEITNNDLTLLSKCDNIFWEYLSANHYAVELLKKRFEYEKSLSKAEYNGLPINHKIDWSRISTNKNAIELIKDRIEYEKSLDDDYEYQALYENGLYNKISWKYMTRNSNAIELLRERIKYEKTLSKENYIKLNNKIDFTTSMVDAKNSIILLKDLLIE